MPLCPAADVVDATLDDQPLVAREVVRADLLPAEGGQRRPRLRGPPPGLQDVAHGRVQKSSGLPPGTFPRSDRHPKGSESRPRGRPPPPPAPPRPRPAAAAAVRACACPAPGAGNFSLPYNRADSARRASAPRSAPPARPAPAPIPAQRLGLHWLRRSPSRRGRCLGGPAPPAGAAATTPGAAGGAVRSRLSAPGSRRAGRTAEGRGLYTLGRCRACPRGPGLRRRHLEQQSAHTGFPATRPGMLNPERTEVETLLRGDCKQLSISRGGPQRQGNEGRCRGRGPARANSPHTGPSAGRPWSSCHWNCRVPRVATGLEGEGSGVESTGIGGRALSFPRRSPGRLACYSPLPPFWPFGSVGGSPNYFVGFFEIKTPVPKSEGFILNME